MTYKIFGVETEINGLRSLNGMNGFILLESAVPFVVHWDSFKSGEPIFDRTPVCNSCPQAVHRKRVFSLFSSCMVLDPLLIL